MNFLAKIPELIIKKMLQYKNLCLLLTTTQTSRRLCLLLEGCPKKSFSVVVSWRSSFHRKNRPAEKSFSVVGQQQAEGLVTHFAYGLL